MRKQLTLIAAASLTLGGLGLRALPPACAEQPAGQERYVAGSLPPGIQRAEKDEADDIRDALADATEAAFNKNDLSDFVDYFVDADRNRIGNWKAAEGDAKLKGRIAQIQKAWRQKYHRAVRVDGTQAFGPSFQGLTIVQGEIANPALLSNWPVANPSANLKGDRLDRTNREGNEPGDRNLEKGRDVAVVTFPASKNLPQVNVSMINEAFGWKIDVPDNISGQQLHDNLLAQLTRFGEMENQWPADVKQAQHMLAHCVLAAVYAVPAQSDGGNQK